MLEIEQELKLKPGRHEIAVVASNKASTSQPQMISLNYSAEQQTRIKPNLYVLAYGISQYADSRHNLNFAHRDAQEFAAAMQRQQGHLYQSVQTRLLTDAEASRQKIVEGMEWLVAASRSRTWPCSSSPHTAFTTTAATSTWRLTRWIWTPCGAPASSSTKSTG